MARKWTCGFEMGSYTIEPTSYVGNTNNLNANSATKRSGSYSFRAGNFNAFVAYVYKNLTAATELYTRFAFMLAAGTTLGNYFTFFSWSNASTGNVLGSLRMNIGGLIEYYNGSSILATGTASIVPGTWYLIEVYKKIANSNGQVTVKVNQVSDIAYTGDTQPGTDTEISQLRWGQGTGGSNDFSNANKFFDDIAVNDTSGANDNSWCGDGQIIWLGPVDNGTYSDLTGSDGNKVNNYVQVDDIPPAGTDYVYGTVVDEKDSYTIANLPTLINPAFSRVVSVARAKVDSGAGNLRHLIRQSGVNYDPGADVALGIDWGYYTYEWLVDPNTNVAWTASGINAIEAGVIVK